MVVSLPYIFQVLYVLCFTRPRYKVSVYRTNGPLVTFIIVSSPFDSNTHPKHMILWRNIEIFHFLSFDSDPKFPPFLLYEPTRCEKTGLWGFRPGPTQTRLYGHRR